MALALLLSGCLGTRYLEKDQTLLYRQKVKAPRGLDTDAFPDLFVQKANRKVLNLPINTLVWMHHEGLIRYTNPESKHSKEAFQQKKAKSEKKFDRKIASANDPRKRSNLQFRKQKRIDALNKKIDNGNLFMQWGEPATVFDTALMKSSAERIKNHLFNRGYFLAQVTPKSTEFLRRVSVVYTLEPGPVYQYDSIIYDIVDSTVAKYVQKSEPASLIKKGLPYSQENLGKERERIDLLLKDFGYYDFSRQYIEFDIDTAFRAPHKIAVRLKINNPTRRNYHKQFIIDSVSVTPDANIQTPVPLKRQSKVYKGITFNYFNDYYSERILRQRIFIFKDSLYSRTKTFDTQRQLANLDLFKFVNVNYDTTGGRFVASIFSSPQDRYSWSNEAGVSLTQGFPGPYYSVSFKKRNIFRGLESFELNGRFGIEGVASATKEKIYGSTEANINATLTFPQFIIPFTRELSNRLGKYNPRTKMLAGYTYTDRPEYARSIITLSNTFNWDNKRTTQYAFTVTNLNIIQSNFKDQEFLTLLENFREQGNNLINTFRPSFVGSMIFTVTWNPNNYGSSTNNSFFVRSSLESGGTLFTLGVLPIKPITDQGLQVYQYVRASMDFRRNQVISKVSNLAFRINTGVSYSYGDNKTLPYEKFFFAGGSNSVRAWRPRRLGQGSYPPILSTTPSSDGTFDYRFEKPGEILLEGSIELRHKLFGFVNGAVFVDAGNVWSFSETDPAPSAATTASWTGSTKFNVDNFYREIGVGTGFGLRFDFTFLILRLDAGIKVWDPARKADDRFVLNKMRFFKPFTDKEPVIFNVGIGYPF